MGLRLRIFLGMMAVVVCALLTTGYVAYRHGVDAERAYNAQRLLRKEAALQRSLSYMLDRLGGTVAQDSLAVVFTDRICELADVHSLTVSLYNDEGRLVTTSAGPGSPDSTVAILLDQEVVEAARGGVGRIQIPEVRGGTEVVWPLTNQTGELLALGHVHYDPRENEQANWQAFLSRLAPVYLLLLVLVSVLAFWLSNSIVRPLKKIIVDMKAGPMRRESHKALEYRWKDEIGALVHSYNALLNQLEESMNERASLEREGAWREMAQQVAHEIKNPLTPLRLGAQHLERAWLDEAPDFADRLKKYTKTTVHQIDTLSRIAESFALLASDGAPDPKRLNVVALLEDVVYLYRTQGVVLNCSHKEIWVQVDGSRLTRALNNLILNALESKPGGSVSVVVRLMVNDEGGAEISIKDDGDGIAADRLPRIFEPKFTTKTHGMGLGLAMVRTIVRGAGGKISVQSEPGVGSVFTVLLPPAIEGF